MRRFHLHLVSLFLFASLVVPAEARAQSADEPVVQAILFFSPSCPHCHLVINEVLVPMVDDYGDQLQIVGVDTSRPDGGQLYQLAIERFQIPRERRGVPTLIIGNVILVGSQEIPDKFPSLVEENLAAGGITWPDIPGFEPVRAGEAEQAPSAAPTTSSAMATPDSGTLASVTPTTVARPTTYPTLMPTATPIPAALVIDDAAVPPTEIEGPPLDPVGFSLAGVLLIGMVVALGYSVLRLMTSRQHLFQLDRNSAAYAESWVIPLLCLAGLGVAVYLAYVEITHVEAVCGPVGECNRVQASPYAQILGVPVAVLGGLTYLGLGLLWVGQKHPVSRVANLSLLGLLGVTIVGTLFSIYLTLVELFVIQAICAWCLSSAAIVTLLLLLVVVPVTGNPPPKRVTPLREKARV
jgi:uncharacterized membrane protein